MVGIYNNYNCWLWLELLSKVKTCTPVFFENLVVELLVKMGYGGTIKEAGKAILLTNDGGIDGIIKEDKLGLDFIYIQAKRWDNQSVGRPDIQSFVGALDGQRATKGVFITTSKFADTAQEYVKTITKKVILIDGRVVFNIKGNHYRLIVKISYDYQMIWIRFIGTHAEYDKINAKTI
jgi:restriction system protein